MSSLNTNSYKLNISIDWNALGKAGQNIDTIKTNLNNWMLKNGFEEIKPSIYSGMHEEKMFAIAFQLLKRTPSLKPYIKKMTYEINTEFGIDKDDLLAYYEAKYGK